jgi:hypothetical protein
VTHIMMAPIIVAIMTPLLTAIMPTKLLPPSIINAQMFEIVATGHVV